MLWIGGTTDSGKSTTAQKFAERHQYDIYHYDRASARHYEILAPTYPFVQNFLDASLDERWIQPSPQEMLDYLLKLFPLRFNLLIADLLPKSQARFVVVEGFGLLPELVQPYLSQPDQAIWFISTRKFKRESMQRRGKPSFAAETSDPERAKFNLFERDILLADYFRAKVLALDYTLHEIDGTLSIDQTVNLVETHFQSYLDMHKINFRLSNEG